MLKDRPEDLRRIRDNRKFISFISENEVTSKEAEVSVFGVKSVNINAILKDNIHNHTEFTIDKLCRMYRSMLYEQLKKYQRKKRNIPFNMFWLLIIVFGVIFAILIILFLLPMG